MSKKTFEICPVGVDYLVRDLDQIYFKSRYFSESKIFVDLKSLGFSQNANLYCSKELNFVVVKDLINKDKEYKFAVIRMG